MRLSSSMRTIIKHKCINCFGRNEESIDWPFSIQAVECYQRNWRHHLLPAMVRQHVCLVWQACKWRLLSDQRSPTPPTHPALSPLTFPTPTPPPPSLSLPVPLSSKPDNNSRRNKQESVSNFCSAEISKYKLVGCCRCRCLWISKTNTSISDLKSTNDLSLQWWHAPLRDDHEQLCFVSLLKSEPGPNPINKISPLYLTHSWHWPIK